MGDTQIDAILSLIENGKAYVVPTEMGHFVCVERAKVSMTTPPVQYAILQKNRYKEEDFPVWAPYVDGKPSPWGNGQATVNLQLISS